MAIIGGLAAAVWEHLRTTHDVDLLLQMDLQEVDPLLDALVAHGIRPKRQPPVVQLGEERVLQLLFEPPGSFVEVQVDLLFGDSAFHRQALAERRSIQVEGMDFPLAVIRCEHLVIFKLLAGRMLDEIDVAALWRIHRQSLDWAEIGRWCVQFKLVPAARAIWQRTYPSEPFPLVEPTLED